MNFVGIIFGVNFRLDVFRFFVVIIGLSIGFDDGWFNVVGENNYNILIGNFSIFFFFMINLGVIINEGELIVEVGESVILLGGIIINIGKIFVFGGEIIIFIVFGENFVCIS